MSKNLILMGNDSLFTLQTGGQKNVPSLVKEKLIKNDNPSDIINVSSTFFNKAEDFIALLKHNITLENILQLYLMGLELTKKNYKGANPGLLEKTILNLYINKNYYKAADRMMDIDLKEQKKGISEILASKEQPTIVLSTFANELMYELSCNPLTTITDKARTKIALKRFEKEDVTGNIIKKYETLIDTTLAVNANSKIICSGIYTPNIMKKNSYVEMVAELNNALKEASIKRNISFLDINDLGSKSKHLDFHLTKEGSEEFASLIISKINEQRQGKAIKKGNQNIKNTGIAGALSYYRAIREELLKSKGALSYSDLLNTEKDLKKQKLIDAETNTKLSENKAKILVCENIYRNKTYR